MRRVKSNWHLTVLIAVTVCCIGVALIPVRASRIRPVAYWLTTPADAHPLAKPVRVPEKRRAADVSAWKYVTSVPHSAQLAVALTPTASPTAVVFPRREQSGSWLDRIVADKPFVWGDKSLYGGLTLTYGVLLGFLVWQILKLRERSE